MRTAITRLISPALGRCELTHQPRAPIDVAAARRQHAAYCRLLGELGWSVEILPADPELPDCVFVEDTAVVLPELAVVARPGAESRRPEIEPVAVALRGHRDLAWIEPPATLDGGDVLVLGDRVWIGLGSRTNADAADQVRAMLEPHGYRVSGVPVDACLHLKSAVTAAGPDRVVLNPSWIDRAIFDGCDGLGRLEIVEVDPAEPNAANVLWLGDALVVPESHPRTAERLRRDDITCYTLDASEVARAEGALTCCSLLIT